MKFPPYGNSFHKYILSKLDPVRYESIALALNTIDKQKLDGAIAEVGVYRGETSKVINKFVSNKNIYLFDSNKINDSGVFPLDYRGTPIPSALRYPDLLDNFNGGRLRLTKSSVQEMVMVNSNIFGGIVRMTTEGIKTNI